MRPVQELKLPALMAVSLVELTGNTAAEWKYHTRAPVLRRLWELSATGPGFASVWIVG